MNKKVKTNAFGQTLRSLRRQRGLTLEKLGELVGVSFRVVSYYEREAKYPPTHLLEPLSKVLRVSIDELLGVKPVKEELNPEHAALWRKLKKVERLSLRDKRAVYNLINALTAKQAGRFLSQNKNGTS